MIDADTIGLFCENCVPESDVSIKLGMVQNIAERFPVKYSASVRNLFADILAARPGVAAYTDNKYYSVRLTLCDFEKGRLRLLFVSFPPSHPHHELFWGETPPRMAESVLVALAESIRVHNTVAIDPPSPAESQKMPIEQTTAPAIAAPSALVEP